ncbi:MAG: PPK2 family polyphosphate kinase [Chitinophagales bacterium]|jgi:PPK2 family polyphosphate:nucleotide phosphotransferase
MIQLHSIPTGAPEGFQKKDLKKKTTELVARLGALQHLMYAQGKYSMLVILQGMDGSGKDGAVRNVFTDCSITGLNLVSFKKPTEEEFAHDFLWRVHKHTPSKGMLTIFNRSHYEDILIQRVHKWIDADRVKMRMKAINAFEQLLEVDNETLVVKFYMHISKEEQLVQLQQRIDDPSKHWKHNDSDWEQRKYWDQYMEAYEYAINESEIPWHICPVDDRWYRDYFIASVLVDRLERLKMELPRLPK